MSDDKLEKMFKQPDHKHGDGKTIENNKKSVDMLKELNSKNQTVVIGLLSMVEPMKDGTIKIHCLSCMQIILQQYRDIALLWEELFEIKIDKPNKVMQGVDNMNIR